MQWRALIPSAGCSATLFLAVLSLLAASASAQMEMEIVAGEVAVTDPAKLAADRKIAEKLVALGAEVTFCETGEVDRVAFVAEDPHSLEPQFSSDQLTKVRPLLDRLSTVGEVSFIMDVRDGADLRQLYGIRGLKKLELQGRGDVKIDAEHLMGVGDGGKLQSLTAMSVDVSRAMPAIAQFDSLEELRLYCRVSDEQLAELAVMPNLRTITLYYGPTTDATAAVLAQVESLETIGMGKCELTDEGVARLARLKNLKQISLGGPHISDRGVAHLAVLGKLTHLTLYSEQITDESLKHVGQITSLEKLTLTGTAITDAGLDSLEGLSNLRTLGVMRTRVTQRRVDALRVKLPRLEAASALPDHIDPATAWMLWRKQALVEWNSQGFSLIVRAHVVGRPADETELSAQNLAAIQGADELASLGLSDCPIADEDIDKVLRFKKLRWLCLAGTHITDTGVARLAELPELKELDLSGTAITDAAVEHLLALERLERVDIQNTRITIQAATRLRRKLQVKTGLE